LDRCDPSNGHVGPFVIVSPQPLSINEDLVENVQNYVNQNPGLNEITHGRYSDHAFYHQSVVLFVYWMLRNRRTMLRDNWPLQQTLLDMLAKDIGVAIGS
jgi:hypothetical protein